MKDRTIQKVDLSPLSFQGKAKITALPRPAVPAVASVRGPICLGTQRVHHVMDDVPLDREWSEQLFVIHHKVLLFHLLPFPGTQLWLFALCVNL